MFLLTTTTKLVLSCGKWMLNCIYHNNVYLSGPFRNRSAPLDSKCEIQIMTYDLSCPIKFVSYSSRNEDEHQASSYSAHTKHC